MNLNLIKKSKTYNRYTDTKKRNASIILSKIIKTLGKRKQEMYREEVQKM